MKRKPGILSLVLVLLFAIAGIGGRTAARAQQAPNGSVAVTNQLLIPVRYQIMRAPASGWETGTVAAGDSKLMAAGCLRFSTGKPAKTVYYLIDASHRYAFSGSGHTILLVNNTGDDRSPIDKTDRANPACAAKK
jgi:hypothetical protein